MIARPDPLRLLTLRIEQLETEVRLLSTEVVCQGVAVRRGACPDLRAMPWSLEAFVQNVSTLIADLRWDVRRLTIRITNIETNLDLHALD